MVNTRKNVELANLLRKEILTGKYGTEGGIPGAKELATRSGLARNTVNSALALLEGEKLIVKRDVAFYVNSISLTMTQYAPPTHIRVSNGYTTNLDTIANQALPDGLAMRLNVAQCTVYRGQVSGETVDGKQQPLMIAHRYYFIPVEESDLQRMKNDAAFDPMWSKYCQRLVSRDAVTARTGTQEELAHLDLPESSTVQNVWESIRDLDGNLLMAQESTLPGRYELVFEFEFDNIPQK